MTDTVPGRYVHLPAELDDSPVMRGPARYRKLPVEIEAMRYIPPSHTDPERTGNAGDIADWANGEPESWADGDDVRHVIQPTQYWGLAGHPQCWDLYVQTLEDGVDGGAHAEHVVSPGDWVVKGVDGEFYPVKHGIFVQTYEPVTA